MPILIKQAIEKYSFDYKEHAVLYGFFLQEKFVDETFQSAKYLA